MRRRIELITFDMRITGVLLAASAALISAPAAQADPPAPNPAQFISDMHAGGIVAPNGDQQLLQVGWGICGRLQSGHTPAEEYQRIASTGIKLSSVQIRSMVAGANNDLCPEVNHDYVG
jgi:hypothetical protein